ncbi:serine hydrolase domain-containing protein [Nocardioides panacisoli]|uniref:Serine hydrolase domain-containing protein n=1 Tax=Nocardioides panacisoli TaxID=627624 RepID=A0ABP7HSY2_9ACTN
MVRPTPSVGGVGTLTDTQNRLRAELPALLEKYDVPAAAWAVLKDGEVVEGAAGVLHRGTGVEATTDSVFQIGSITKLWTATLVMQLVDEGEVDLDVPFRTYLPDFRIGDEDAAARITTRMLLTHTAGFEGDIFTDTGVGDDCIEKFVGVLHDVPQLFLPGELWSYNNAGYSLLGRMVEVLRGKSYDECLRDHIFTPLALTHAAPTPYEAIMFRAAMGHVQHEPGGRYEPAPIWGMVRSNAPAGSLLSMTARDLITFARMHLEDGKAQDGTQVLAPGTAARMLEAQVELPYLGVLGTSWGLGFERYDLEEGVLAGHDGNTIGQNAYLRFVPGTGVAVALLTNGGDAIELYHDVAGSVLAELTDVRMPALPAPPAEPERIDASRFEGTYSTQNVDLTVSQDEDGRIWADQVPKSELAEELGAEAERRELVHFEGDSLINLEPIQGMHIPHVFLGDDGDGHAQYLHIGRAVRRV